MGLNVLELLGDNKELNILEFDITMKSVSEGKVSSNENIGVHFAHTGGGTSSSTPSCSEPVNTGL